MISLFGFIQTHSLVAIELPILLVIIVLAKVILLKRVRAIEAKKMRVSSIEPPQQKSGTVITSQDIKAIAGEDVMVTQLDLARAYIELGKKSLAKQILEHVLANGDQPQQMVARQLIESIA
jgi:FimV-like protein